MLKRVFCDWLGWHSWPVVCSDWDGTGKPPMFCRRCFRYSK